MTAKKPRKGKLLIAVAACFALLSLIGCQSNFIGMLNPKGIIAHEERKLFFDTLALMLIVVLPVIIMSFAFVYHYRAKNKKSEYKPNWSHSYFLEALWWGIPCAIIVVLAVMTWKSSHKLDPYARINLDNQPPMLIQVVALPWKWLFIYPEQKIATVNYLAMPVGRQVEFWMTTDNVAMSAFFIPQLGSQIYAMAGMRTRLHLFANQVGVYDGLNTQFNGDGFSGMHFEVHVLDKAEMDQWVKGVKASAKPLTEAAYLQLLNPSDSNPPAYFSNIPADLFNKVVMLYMHSVGTEHPRSAQTQLLYPVKSPKE